MPSNVGNLAKAGESNPSPDRKNPIPSFAEFLPEHLTTINPTEVPAGRLRNKGVEGK